MKQDSVRVISKKNYLILGLILLVSLLFLYYLYMWYDAWKDSKLNIPILDNYLEVINYNELDNYLVENPDSIIYVSVLEDEKIRDFEKKFKNSIRSNSIKNNILYMNITNDIDSITSDKYLINSHSIIDYPCILVFSDGNLVSFYDIDGNDYNISDMITFINNIKNGDEQ